MGVIGSVIGRSTKMPFQKTRNENPTLTNIGKKWSKSEEADLLNRISKGESIQQIGTELKRTTGGISRRLVDIACTMVLSGKSIEEAISATTINKLTVLEGLVTHKYKDERKKINNPEPQQQQNSDIKELLSLTRDIHSMMKEILAQKNHPPPVKKLLTLKTISKSRCLIRDD